MQARDQVIEVVISRRMSLLQAAGIVFDRISTSVAAVVIEHLSEPAAVYILWPIVVMIIIVQFLRPFTKEVEQPRSVLITEKVEIVEEERIVTVDTGVGTEPMSIDILRSIARAQCAIRPGRSLKRIKSRDSMIAKERFFEEQTTFIDASEEDKSDLDETLLDPTMTSFVCKSDKSLLALPKVGIQIVRFEKEDFNDGIGLITAVKGDSLIVKKVVKGSAACGRVCSGDRISAINGNSISIGQKSGELLQSLLKEAVNKREPFEMTIVIGSRLEDLGISRMSCSFLPCSQENQ